MVINKNNNIQTTMTLILNNKIYTNNNRNNIQTTIISFLNNNTKNNNTLNHHNNIHVIITIMEN